MSSGPENPVPWDESTALEELERLKRGIEEWRQRRKDVQADFDRFVRGFRMAALERKIVEASEPPSAVLSASETAADVPNVSVPTPMQPVAVPTPTVIARDLATPSLEAALTPTEPSPPSLTAAQGPAPSAEQRRRRTQVMVVTGGLAVVVAAGALLTRSWGGKPGKSADASARPAAARATPVPGPKAPSESRSNPAVPESPRSEITALRRVWVRVTVDGVREVERELPAGERVPLRPGRTIVIRAGNAGAVQLLLNGEDRGTLGPEGQVVTRTLQIPPTPNR